MRWRCDGGAAVGQRPALAGLNGEPHLLICKHCLVDGVPVDLGLGPVRQIALVKAQEQPLQVEGVLVSRKGGRHAHDMRVAFGECGPKWPPGVGEGKQRRRSRGRGKTQETRSQWHGRGGGWWMLQRT